MRQQCRQDELLRPILISHGRANVAHKGFFALSEYGIDYYILT